MPTGIIDTGSPKEKKTEIRDPVSMTDCFSSGKNSSLGSADFSFSFFHGHFQEENSLPPTGAITAGEEKWLSRIRKEKERLSCISFSGCSSCGSLSGAEAPDLKIG